MLPNSCRGLIMTLLTAFTTCSLCSPAAKAQNPPNPHFKTEGLFDPNLFTKIENGSLFVFQLISKKDAGFQILLDGYITAYGTLCSNYLPVDKVQWEIRTCSDNDQGHYECKDHPTPVFVDKNIYDLKKQLLVEFVADNVPVGASAQGTFWLLQKSFQNLTESLNQTKQRYYAGLWLDSFKIVIENGCESPELRRFQDNLIRHGLGIPMLTTAVPLVAPSKFPPAKSPPLPSGRLSFEKIDYLQLILDMKNIKDNRGRASFSDIPVDSIKNVHAVRLDTEGKPSVIEADCRIDWDDGHPPPCEGLVLRMTSTGYPMCLRIKSTKLDDPADPPCMRSVFANDEITSKFQAGGYSR